MFLLSLLVNDSIYIDFLNGHFYKFESHWDVSGPHLHNPLWLITKMIKHVGLRDFFNQSRLTWRQEIIVLASSISCIHSLGEKRDLWSVLNKTFTLKNLTNVLTKKRSQRWRFSLTFFERIGPKIRIFFGYSCWKLYNDCNLVEIVWFEWNCS